jgi:hypothetical protein
MLQGVGLQSVKQAPRVSIMNQITLTPGECLLRTYAGIKSRLDAVARLGYGFSN